MEKLAQSRSPLTLGVVRHTAGVGHLALETSELGYLVDRHRKGDWGNLCDEDREANARALADGDRLLSVYDTPKGRVWILTEADRSHTTLLLPEEY